MRTPPRPRDAAPYTAAISLAFSFGPSLLRRQRQDQLIVSLGALALGGAAGAATEQLVVRLTRRLDGDEPAARLTLAAVGLLATLTELPESRTRAVAVAGNGARVAGIAALVGWAAPQDIPPGRKRALFAIAAAGAGVAGFAAWKKQQRRATRPQLRYPHADWLDTVSGGGGSIVPRKALDFEGERFLAGAAPAAAISELRDGAPTRDPIRVFVGMKHAESVEERCRLAVEELERLGAFQRNRILVISATLRGYVNPIPVETEEVISHGDTASVVVQYHDRRTPFLWRKVPIAARTHRELLELLAARDDLPELCVYGESLGAWSSQRVFGERGIDDLERLRVARALWIGTPYFSRFGRRIGRLGDPRVAFLNARDASSTDPGAGATWRWVFLQRMSDPVVVFPGIDLIWREPEWMKRQTEMHWRPGITFLQQLVDVVRATAWTTDEPTAVGHDYRTVAPHAINIALGHGLNSDAAERIGIAVLAREAARARRVRAARKAAAGSGMDVPPDVPAAATS